MFARGGTSKGLFLRTADLPDAGDRRDALLMRALGSPVRATNTGQLFSTTFETRWATG